MGQVLIFRKLKTKVAEAHFLGIIEDKIDVHLKTCVKSAQLPEEKKEEKIKGATLCLRRLHHLITH